MTRFSILFLSLLFILTVSCGDNTTPNEGGEILDDSGVVIYKPFNWKKSVYEDPNQEYFKSRLFGNWSWNNMAMIHRRINSKPITLTAIDLDNGEIVWEWDDYFNPETELTNGRFFSRTDNIFHWKTGDRQYWIDLESGSTINKVRSPQSFTHVMEQLGDIHYSIGFYESEQPDVSTTGVFGGNFLESNPSLILNKEVDPNQIHSGRANDIVSVNPVIIENDTLLVIGWQQIFENIDFQSYLGLYNLSKNYWEYDSIALCEPNPKGVLYQPFQVFQDDVITNVGKSLISYNYKTGEKNWEEIFDHDFSFAGFEIANDVLVASCENQRVYGLNATTGNLIWSSPGSGTPSNLKNRILNDVVYFGGGSSGFLHAIDINSGKTLWKLDPDLYEMGSDWDWSITVSENLSGIGKIVIQNLNFAYCLDAAR